MLYLFLLFTLMPLLELALLIQVGQWLGTLPTIALVMITGGVGVVLARQQGWETYRRLTEQLRQGQAPTDTLTDGALILIAATLLVTPGVLTDAVGLSLLIPPVRKQFKRLAGWWLRRKAHIKFQQITTRFSQDGTQIHTQTWTNRPGTKPTNDDEPIEVEFERR